MKKNKIIIISAFLLLSCSNSSSSSLIIDSSNASVNSISESVSSNKESATSESVSLKESSINVSSINSSSSSNSLISTISSSENKESSSTSNDNELSKSEAIKALSETKKYDSLISSLKVTYYNIRSTSYQTQNYTINSYSDNVLIMNGLTVDKDSSTGVATYSSEFKEQRSFENDTYYRIKKFDNTYLNSAYKETTTLENVKDELNIYQGALAYSTYLEYSSSISLTYKGEILADNTKHFSFVAYEETSYDNNMLAYGIEVSIAPEGNISDLFYTKGYYDTMYCDNDVATLRKHGPLPPDYTVDAGYTYSVSRIKTTAKTALGKENYPFAYEDNFLNSISFSSEEITVSLASENKYINLVDYLNCSPNGSLTGVGCPLNNLEFTSDDPSVISIGDTFYGDFVSSGIANISVSDPISGVTSPNKLKIIVE